MAQETSTLTNATQIERLLRPGSTYRNLNPYEVLEVEPDEDDEVIRKKIRKVKWGEGWAAAGATENIDERLQQCGQASGMLRCLFTGSTVSVSVLASLLSIHNPHCSPAWAPASPGPQP